MADSRDSAMTLSRHQLHGLEIIERVASCFSVVGASFIFFTFVYSSEFRKPINRLIFYASWGNILCNVATLMAQSGIRAGRDSGLCQFQAFLIQQALPADAMWNLCMAINVYLTIFHKYRPERLKRLEKYYIFFCYGLTFIIAIVCLFISTPARGKIYGPNVVWCSIDIKWVFLRIGLVYGPAWFCIMGAFFLYIITGFEIFKKRAQLVKFNSPHTPQQEMTSRSVENPYTDFKTTEIEISSEPAALTSPRGESPDSMPSTRNSHLAVPAPMTGSKYQSSVTTTIRSTPSRLGSDHSIPMVAQSAQTIQQRKKQRAAVEFNTAALGYTKVALLFFCSLLITWVPPSVNRFNSLLHPHMVNVPSSYATAVVLPLMGFWNSVIYIVTSWRAVRKLFCGELSRPPLVRGQSSSASIPRLQSSWSRKGSESGSESVEGLASKGTGDVERGG